MKAPSPNHWTAREFPKCLHFEYAEACDPDMPAQNTDYLPFFPTSNHLSPHLRPPCLSHKYPNSLQGGRSETYYSPISSLGCLVNKLFLGCKPWHLSVWLAEHQDLVGNDISGGQSPKCRSLQRSFAPSRTQQPRNQLHLDLLPEW